MFRTAIVSSRRFALSAFALTLVTLTALTSAGPVTSAALPQAPTVLRTTVSAGRPTAFTDLDQIDQDLQAERIGDVFGAALMQHGGTMTSFIPALRAIEGQFSSVQAQPMGVKYCYEYDPITDRTYITCKEARSASIVENAGDTPVVLHLEIVTEI